MERLEGIPFMKKRRKTVIFTNLLNGPGKLAKALAIDSSCNGRDLFGNEFFPENTPTLSTEMIGTSTRIGISKSRELQ